MKVGGRSIDLRVATLPTVYGEKVVMRILDKGQAVLQPRGARLPARDRTARFEACVPQAVRHDPRDRPDRFGQVDDAVRDAQPCSTTPDRNIITVEDPVEYRLPGINQVQINPKAGLTFAARAAVDPARRPRHRARR